MREGIGGDFWIIGSQGQNVRGLTLVHSLLAEWNSEENWSFYFKYWSLHIYCAYMLCAGGECIWTDYRNTVFVWPPTIICQNRVARSSKINHILSIEFDEKWQALQLRVVQFMSRFISESKWITNILLDQSRIIPEMRWDSKRGVICLNLFKVTWIQLHSVSCIPWESNPWPRRS